MERQEDVNLCTKMTQSDHGHRSATLPKLDDAIAVEKEDAEIAIEQVDTVVIRLDGKATLSRRNGIMRRLQASANTFLPSFDVFGGSAASEGSSSSPPPLPDSSNNNEPIEVESKNSKSAGDPFSMKLLTAFITPPSLTTVAPEVQRHDGSLNKPTVVKSYQNSACHSFDNMKSAAKPLIAPKPRFSLPADGRPTNQPNRSASAVVTGLKVPDASVVKSSESQRMQHRRTEDDGDRRCDGGADDDDDEFTDDDDDDGCEDDEENETRQNHRRSLESNESESSSESDRFLTAVQKIVKEFWTTEKAYVARLHLISQDFHSALVNANKLDPMISESGMQTIFGSVQTIYQFHDKFLLPELYECSVEGGEKKWVGEVMKKNAPFLKMYTTYMQNFDASFALIEKLRVNSVKFAKFIDSFQQLPICRKLSIQNHMLEPVQRIPRYELLLKDYIRHLDDASTDKSHANEALKQVSAIAVRCNESLKDMESSMKLINILRNISGCDGLLSPGCSLVKEGRALTLCKRSKELREKHIYLLSDRLLLCRPTSVVLRTQFRLVAKMDLNGMKLLDGEEPHSFCIHSKQKFAFLRFSSLEEREEWQSALLQVISSQSQGPTGHIDALQSLEELDSWSPCWLKDDVTNVCMICCVELTRVNRKIHCRACGAIVCGECASRKMALSFCGMSEKKVCDNCFAIVCRLRRTHDQSNTVYRNKPLFKLLADVPIITEGFLLTSRDRTSWQKRWFRLHQDSILCAYLDQKIPESSMFLSEYQLKLTPEITNDGGSSEFGAHHSFMLSLGKKKAVLFRAPGHQDLVRWISNLHPHVSR